jgi:hypothetical protein
MSTKNLGRLQKVELREAWLREASGFTPWLTFSISNFGHSILNGFANGSKLCTKFFLP